MVASCLLFTGFKTPRTGTNQHLKSMSHIYTDTIDRNPDVNFDKGETIPEDCYLHEGKRLMDTARAAKVPFGVATKRTRKPGNPSDSRMETVGLVIRKKDRAKFALAVAHQNAKKKYPK